MFHDVESDVRHLVPQESRSLAGYCGPAAAFARPARYLDSMTMTAPLPVAPYDGGALRFDHLELWALFVSIEKEQGRRGNL
jgi:hypothetical protein